MKGKIGDKVKIKDYPFRSNYEGQIGVITSINKISYFVQMEDGNIIQPYAETQSDAQCELLEEKQDYNNCVIEVLDAEHGVKVIKWWKEQGVNTGDLRGYNTKVRGSSHRFYGMLNGEFVYNNENYLLSKGCKIITLPEELPEKWYIRRNSDNCREINDWCNNNLLNNDRDGYKSPSGYVHSHAVNNTDHKRSSYDIQEGHTEITIEQFRKLIKQNNMKQYQLKKEFNYLKFKEAANKISGTTVMNTFNQDSSVYNSLKEAGVLDLWFEVVPDFKVGDYVVLTKNPTGWLSGTKLGTVLELTKDKTQYCGGMMFTAKLLNTILTGGIDDGHYRKATPEEVKAAQTIEILGYKAEKTSNGVKFGCQSFDTNTLNVLKDLLSRTEVKFGISLNGVHPLTLEEIDKLLAL